MGIECWRNGQKDAGEGDSAGVSGRIDGAESRGEGESGWQMAMENHHLRVETHGCKGVLAARHGLRKGTRIVRSRGIEKSAPVDKLLWREPLQKYHGRAASWTLPGGVRFA